jgi:tripartite ATP-independent transporter DctM subunit
MTDLQIGIVGLVTLIVLLLLRMPVALAMMLVGFVGTLVINPTAALPVLAGEAFSTSTLYSMSMLPMFVLMGNIAGVAGLSRDLYDAAHAWMGRFRGGLASATVIGSAGFSAMSGSSLASAVTMGRVALPEMKRFRYDDGLSTGVIAAGGTLGILIPPSAGFIVYSILTEESIGRLFIAGVVPGLILTALFIVAIMIQTHLKPSLAPMQEVTVSSSEKFAALRRSLWIIGIILVTIGGIYLGVFSAIEAAGIGTLLTCAVAAVRRKLTISLLKEAVANTLQATGTTFLILIGAFVLTPFVTLSGIPDALLGVIAESGAGPYTVLILILLILILLGTFLEGFAILVLTLPFIQPMVMQAGFDMIWFGVLMVIVLEMGLISPPVGINVFVVSGIAPDVPMRKIYRGVIPFWIAMFLVLIALIIFPSLATSLPDSMFGAL